MERKIKLYNKEEIDYTKLLESFQGWQAYAKWDDRYKLRTQFNMSRLYFM